MNKRKGRKKWSAKKKAWCFTALVLCASILLSVAVYLHSIRPAFSQPYLYYGCENFNQSTEALTDGTEIRQTFLAREQVTGAVVRFSVAEPGTPGTAHFSIRSQETGEVLGSTDIDLSTLANNQMASLLFDPVPGSEGKTYDILLTFDGIASGSAYSMAVAGGAACFPDGALLINGEEQDADLSFLLYSPDAGFLLAPYWILAAFVILAFTLVTYFIFIRKWRLEKVFLFSALTLGFVFMFLSTPYSGYDEPAHFDTAYRYSNAIMMKGLQTETGGVLKRESDVAMNGLTPARTTLRSYRTAYDGLFLRDDSPLVDDAGARFVREAPYVYFPSAAAITIGRILHFGRIPLLYLGRLFNLVCFAVITYFAIKRMPFGKPVLFATATVPLMLQQAASYSYDACIVALSLFFIANCLYVAFTEKEIRIRDLVALCIAGVLLAPLKMVYGVLCLLCLLIPIWKLGTKKRYFTTAGIFCAAVVIIYCAANLAILFQTAAQTDKLAIATTSPTIAYSFSDLVHTPGVFVNMFLANVKGELGNFLLSMTSGLYLINLPNYIAVLCLFLLVFASFRQEKEKQYLQGKHKALIVGIVLLVYVGLHIAGFTWTAKGSTVIQGVQGRYFLPVLPVLLLCLRNSTLTYKRNMERPILFSAYAINVLALALGAGDLI